MNSVLPKDFPKNLLFIHEIYCKQLKSYITANYILGIPKGNKACCWITKDHCEIGLIDTNIFFKQNYKNKTKSIDGILSSNCIQKMHSYQLFSKNNDDDTSISKLITPGDEWDQTLFYGTRVQYKNINFFVLEQVLTFHGKHYGKTISFYKHLEKMNSWLNNNWHVINNDTRETIFFTLAMISCSEENKRFDQHELINMKNECAFDIYKFQCINLTNYSSVFTIKSDFLKNNINTNCINYINSTYWIEPESIDMDLYHVKNISNYENIGYAHIPNKETSSLLRLHFLNNNKEQLFKCQWNSTFGRWQPIEKV